MTPSRCTVLSGGAFLAFAGPLSAQIGAQDEVVDLWPGTPPGSPGTSINSIAMTEAKRPVALHVFEDGGHGFGPRLAADRSVMAWRAPVSTLASSQGVLG